MEPSLLLYVAVYVVRNAVPVASPTVRSTNSIFDSCYGCQGGGDTADMVSSTSCWSLETCTRQKGRVWLLKGNGVCFLLYSCRQCLVAVVSCC
jgi:hypothetical protein